MAVSECSRETSAHFFLGQLWKCDCVMPILMYGCENWIVSEELLRQLESFQEEMGKRILGVPRCASNTAVGMVMGWPSIQARVLMGS